MPESPGPASSPDVTAPSRRGAGRRPRQPAGPKPVPARALAPREWAASAGLFFSAGLLSILSWHWRWELTFVALTPLAIGICRQRRRGAVLWTFLTGWLLWFFIQHPLWVFSQRGIAVLAAYQALTLVPVAVGVRELWRRWRVPLAWSWPVAWVGGEYLRSLGPLGFPWGNVAGPCFEQTWMLQVCDLGGVCALSFPIALVQGWLADLALALRPKPPASPPRSPRWPQLPALAGGVRLRLATATVLAAWTFVGLYGAWRLDGIGAEMRPGPRVAVIQPDVPYVAAAPQSYDPDLLVQKLQELTGAAVRAGSRPDLVIWPEGITGLRLRNREFLTAAADPRPLETAQAGADHRTLAPEQEHARWLAERRQAADYEQRFAQWVRRLGTTLVLGMHVIIPPSPEAPARQYNAAQIYEPETGQTASRQAKMRLYPLGECAPWADTWLAPVLGRWLRPVREFTPGDRRQVFQLPPPDGKPDGAAEYAVSLCSEIMYPGSSGHFLAPRGGRKRFDFLVNIANEGSFLRNRAQPCVFTCLPFRAVEGRIGIARSANTGISGFVAPTGRIYGLVTNAAGQARTGLGAPELPLIRDLLGYRQAHEADFATDPAKHAELRRRIAQVNALRDQAGIEGWSVAQVYTHAHITLYQRWGDWLGQLLLAGLAATVSLTLWPGTRDRTPG